MGIEGQDHLWDKEAKGHRTYNDVRIYKDEELKNYTEDELKSFKIKHDTPMMEELEKVIRGSWPPLMMSKISLTVGSFPARARVTSRVE